MKKYQKLIYIFLFALLTYFFYCLTFPLKNSIDLANQKSKIATGFYIQNKNSFEIFNFVYFKDIEIFKNNQQVAKADSACFLNIGVFIIGNVKNIDITAIPTDLNIQSTTVFYSPFNPKSLSISSSGNFGEMSIALRNNVATVSIEPSQKLLEFKSSLAGSSIFSGFNNWQASYEY